MTHPPIDQQITFLYTHDLAGTASFYEQTMGLPLKLDQGTCRIYQVGQTAYLGFCQRSTATGAPLEADSDDHDLILTLVTPLVDEWFEYLRHRGVAFEKSPALNKKYDIYHCFLRDPNGYLIEIQQFLHPF
jgi:catechol 2,3-dioxygenase-like lactoylglutathione lyase family enzyme